MCDDIASLFIDGWNLRSSSARRRALTALLSPDMRYDDPHYEDAISGRERYFDFVDIVHEQLPEIRFALLDASHHHRAGLIDWSLRLRPDSAPSYGSFFYELSDRSHIVRILGFARSKPPRLL